MEIPGEQSGGEREAMSGNLFSWLSPGSLPLGGLCPLGGPVKMMGSIQLSPWHCGFLDKVSMAKFDGLCHWHQ